MAAIKPRPLLIIGDAISCRTGLGRIIKEIASRVYKYLPDVYRVATFGYGGPGTSKYSFPQFVIEGMNDWIIPTLPDVVADFFGDERGVIMFIWDITRLTWFAQPERMAELTDKFPGLRQSLINIRKNADVWVYVPMDASGPNDQLTFPLKATVVGFDRLLTYTKFGEDVIRRSIGDEESNKRHLTNLPHGIDSDVFFELDRKSCRKVFFGNTGAMAIDPQTGMTVKPKAIEKDEILVGIVATNQNRKDWALGIETAARLTLKHKVRLWIHTDSFERYWSIPSLLLDYGMLDKTVTSLGYISDAKMANAYSACDLTLGIGPEGMGYPIFESMFCGTPCLHGNYGGAPEYMGANDEERPLLVDPIAYRYEGEYAMRRPVYSAADWAVKADKLIGARVNHPGELDWNNLWPRWEAWFRGAL